MIGLGQFWPELRKRIDRHYSDRAGWIASGKATDYVNYREVVAELKALDWVRQEAAKINEDRFETDDEE